MTDKEATVFIIDTGKSMGQKNGGRKISDLDWAMTYVWDKMTTTIALDRKTTFQAVVSLKSDQTDNHLSHTGFENIATLQEFKALNTRDLKNLQRKLVPNKTDEGDAVDAIVLAIDLITRQCAKLKYKRKIVLITNGQGHLDADQDAEIVKKLKNDDIELLVLGIDFDDPEYGFKEENKSSRKAKNEKLLKQLVEDSDGIYGTLAQAIEELGQPRVKITRPIASFKGAMTIGSPSGQYGNTVSIAVERYPKVMVRKPPSASTVKRGTSQEKPESSGAAYANDDMDVDGDDAKAIKSERHYYVDDENEPEGRREVNFDELVRGYEYGRSIVPLSESEQNITNLQTEPCLEILGFISSKEASGYFTAANQLTCIQFPREMLMTTSHIIVGARSNAEATLALSSLAHALLELEDYAVARFVAKKDKAPLVVLLAPLIDPDYECLVELELPFAEDVRTYRFAPLDKILTVTGKEITEHAKLPDEQLKQAMSEYVDRMDLTTFGDDEEGKPAEYGRIDEIYSPLLHRLDQVVRWRATQDSGSIPDPYPILTKYAAPPNDLILSTSKQLTALKAAAKVEKVPAQAKSRRSKPTTNPISGLDINALLEPVFQIDPKNPIPSFERMINPPTHPDGPAPDADRIAKASAGLERVIEERITRSFGSMEYERALEEIGHLRTSLDELEEAGLWNAWLRTLKQKIKDDALGGDRLEFWIRMRNMRLGLLFEQPRRLVASRVSEKDAEEAREKWMDEARAFWALK